MTAPLIIGGALTVLACTALLIAQIESLPLLLLVIAVNSIFLQFYFGPLFLVPVEILGPRIAGTATGFSNLFANIGGFLTAWAMGAIKDQSGSFKAGFISISVICLIGVALSLILSRMRSKALAAATLSESLPR